MDDLQNDGVLNDANSAQPSQTFETSNAEQSDYEARFKGLQRTYNKLKQDYDALTTRMSAKEQTATKAFQEAEQLKQQLEQFTTNYEGQLSQLNAQLATAQEEIQSKESEIESFQMRLERQTTKDNLRKTLAELDPKLIGAFESGYLKPYNEDGTPLDGDALSEYVNGFKSWIDDKSTQDFDKAMSGATPPNVGTSTASPVGGMNVNQMEEWLDNPNNYGHAQYNNVLDQYTAKIAEKTPNKLSEDYI